MNPNNGNLAPVSSGSVMIPNFSAYAGTLNNVASLKMRSNVADFLADNELKMDILKKQHICHSQVCDILKITRFKK